MLKNERDLENNKKGEENQKQNQNNFAILQEVYFIFIGFFLLMNLTRNFPLPDSQHIIYQL